MEHALDFCAPGIHFECGGVLGDEWSCIVSDAVFVPKTARRTQHILSAAHNFDYKKAKKPFFSGKHTMKSRALGPSQSILANGELGPNCSLMKKLNLDFPDNIAYY